MTVLRWDHYPKSYLSGMSDSVQTNQIDQWSFLRNILEVPHLPLRSRLRIHSLSLEAKAGLVLEKVAQTPDAGHRSR